MDHTNFKYNVAVLIHWGVSVNKAIIQHYILQKNLTQINRALNTECRSFSGRHKPLLNWLFYVLCTVHNVLWPQMHTSNFQQNRDDSSAGPELNMNTFQILPREN